METALRGLGALNKKLEGGDAKSGEIISEDPRVIKIKSFWFVEKSIRYVMFNIDSSSIILQINDFTCVLLSIPIIGYKL